VRIDGRAVLDDGIPHHVNERAAFERADAMVRRQIARRADRLVEVTANSLTPLAVP
jgi:hypothetical protein